MFMKLFLIFVLVSFCLCNADNNSTIPCLCENNGTCSNGKNCTCPKNFHGETCELKICDKDSVLSEQCHNGTCLTNTLTNESFCQCKPTHTGALCEKEKCSDYCYNGGHCNNGLDEDFTNYLDKTYSVKLSCKCQSERFSGDRCQFDKCFHKIDNCSSKDFITPDCKCLIEKDCGKNYCNSKGNCYHDDASLKCRCNGRYKGPNCELDKCDGFCSNNGTCLFDEISQQLFCKCEEGFNGTFCDIVKPNQMQRARSSLRFIIYALALTLSVCLIVIGCSYSLQNGHLKNFNLPRINPFGHTNRASRLVRGDFSFNKLEDEHIIVQNDHLVNA